MQMVLWGETGGSAVVLLQGLRVRAVNPACFGQGGGERFNLATSISGGAKEVCLLGPP